MADVMAAISRHARRNGWKQPTLNISSEQKVAMKRIGELAEFPHLLEQFMSDMKCNAGQAPGGSSITGGWKKPASRFDVFVESSDPRIGVFAACLAANLMNNFIAGNPVEDDTDLLLEVAGLITAFPETKGEIAKLAVALSESVENISSTINQLAHFAYFDNGTTDNTR